VREVRGVRVGFLAFTAQMNHEAGRGARVARLDTRALDAVRALDARVDAVLASLHWGQEVSTDPTPGQVALAHRLVDAGADAIPEHHPHVLQSVERYRDRPIAYSLRYLVFGPQPSPRDLSAILERSLARGRAPIVRAALRPIRLEGPLGTPTLVTGPRAAAVTARLRATSQRFRTAFTERDGALELDLALPEPREGPLPEPREGPLPEPREGPSTVEPAPLHTERDPTRERPAGSHASPAQDRDALGRGRTCTRTVIRRIDAGRGKVSVMARRVLSWILVALSACGSSGSPRIPGCEGQPRSRCVAELSLGDRFGCALLRDGTPWCWGRNDESQLGYDASELCPERLANGQTRAVACHRFPQQSAGVVDAIAISAGAAHVCTLGVAGAVRCWGSNTVGQLGNGAALPSVVAVTVTGLEGASAVRSGARHACAIVRGAVLCWGANDRGQLGVADTGGLCAVGDQSIPCARAPVAVAGVEGAVELAAGEAHTCARTERGEVLCWGSNVDGELGDGEPSTRPSHTPRAVRVGPLAITGVTTVVAGGRHTCALRDDGAALCWGVSAQGQLGVEIPMPPYAPCAQACVPSPIAVDGFEGARADGGSPLDASPPDALARDGASLDATSTRRDGGAMGGAMDGGRAETDADTPRRDATASDVPSSGRMDAALDAEMRASEPARPASAGLSAGAAFSCLRLTDGTVRCFGANRVGELGNGRADEGGPTASSVIASPGSAPTNPLQSVGAIASGASASCALLADRSVRCWGSNESGALGQGTLGDPLGPVALTW
jgi:alpha-tubulin suppressor-like RCC1 family protein